RHCRRLRDRQRRNQTRAGDKAHVQAHVAASGDASCRGAIGLPRLRYERPAPGRSTRRGWAGRLAAAAQDLPFGLEPVVELVPGLASPALVELIGSLGDTGVQVL